MPATKKLSAREKAQRKETAKRIGEEVVAGLEQLLATLEAGGVEAVVKKHGLPPPPEIVVLKVSPAGKREVKSAREALGVSQFVFALILGTSVPAVRAWEQGTKSPPGAVSRLIGEIRHDPGYWRKRFGLAEVAKG